jgi:hypothetical protein
MKLPRHLAVSDPSRRGAALLLSLLLLFVLVAITIQISVTTGTDARVARNDLTMTGMDLAIESAMLQMQETLKTDGEGAGSDTPASPAESTNQAGAAQGQQPANGQGTAPGSGTGSQGSSDTRKDEWATPQRTEINEVRLRILVVDEDSKYNVLNLANPDDKEAEAALGRVSRILDACREGTELDIDSRTAEEMARAMRDHLLKRDDSRVPRPKLLTDDEQNRELGLPRSLLEFAGLSPFEPMHFRDVRDVNGKVAHSIGAFLTVWTAVSTAGEALGVARAGQEAVAGGGSNQGGSTQGGSSAQGGSEAQAGSTTQDGRSAQTGSGQSSGQNGSTQSGAGSQGGNGAQTGGQAGGAAGAASGNTNGSTNGGYGVNLNTAPPAVLKGLFDDREVDPRFLDEIIEYRNLEEEEEDSGATTTSEEEAEESVRYDEWGNEVLDLRAFEELAELQQVSGYDNLEGAAKDALTKLLTVESHVFSVYFVARRNTSAQGDLDPTADPEEARRREEQGGESLVRVVRAVYWRRKSDAGVDIVPLVRWEVLDYLPIEVLDYPEEDR